MGRQWSSGYLPAGLEPGSWASPGPSSPTETQRKPPRPRHAIAARNEWHWLGRRPEKYSVPAESARLPAGRITWVIARKLSRYGRTTAAGCTPRRISWQASGIGGCCRCSPIRWHTAGHPPMLSALWCSPCPASGFPALADGRADPPPGRGGGAPASVDPGGGSVIRLGAAERAGAAAAPDACEDHQGSRNSFVRCCCSLSVLRAGGGQPLVEPDGLVSVGNPRSAHRDGQIDVGGCKRCAGPASVSRRTRRGSSGSRSRGRVACSAGTCRRRGRYLAARLRGCRRARR